MDDFFAFFVSAALHAEIRIDQQQRFYGQVLQFQIPGRMIGRNVTDDRHSKTIHTKVCIVIVEVRNPLLLVFSASVFPDIMARRRAGDQGQVYRHACSIKLSCRMHGHIVHPRHMSQGVKRRDIDPDTHEFVKIQGFGHLPQLQIFLCKAFCFHLCSSQELHILRRIVGQMQHLIAVNAVENLQKPESALPVLVSRMECFVDFRKQSGQGVAVAVPEPSFFRLFCQGRDSIPDDR